MNDATDENVHSTTPDDDPRVEVLQAVVDRVTSWQDTADEQTVRAELDRALGKADVHVDDDVRDRIVARITQHGAHFRVTEVLH